MRALFYDTWAFSALANSADPAHQPSVEADCAIEQSGYVSVTTDYVFDETVTLLHVAAGSRVACLFIDFIQAQAEAEDLLLVDVTRSRRQAALAYFRKLAPETPRLSFTDCVSFAVMAELGIEVAFTADRHFHRAGHSIRPLFERRRGTLTWHL